MANPTAQLSPERVLGWGRKHPFLLVVGLVALASCFLTPPSSAYFGYLDFRTLVGLFAALAVIAGLRSAGVFEGVSAHLVGLVSSRRLIFLVLTLITCAVTMIVTNDVVLIVMLPFTATVLYHMDDERYLPFMFVVLNLAANLGGMVSPMGSPHNLYLLSHFDLSLTEFVRVLWIPTLISVTMLSLMCLAVPGRRVRPELPHYNIQWGLVLGYTAVLVLAVTAIFGLVPLWVALLCPIMIAGFDRTTLRNVDYKLLATFVLFFIFAGNIAQSDAVREFLTRLADWDGFLTAVSASQVVSNVPTAIILSRVAEPAPLLLGVNVGGCGTLIASLASLITLRHVHRYRPQAVREFVVLFTVVNLVFLVILTVVSQSLLSAGIIQ